MSGFREVSFSFGWPDCEALSTPLPSHQGQCEQRRCREDHIGGLGRRGGVSDRPRPRRVRGDSPAGPRPGLGANFELRLRAVVSEFENRESSGSGIDARAKPSRSGGIGEHGTEPLKNANVAAEPPPPQAAPSTVGALALDVKSMEYPYQSTTKSVNRDPNGAEAS